MNGALEVKNEEHAILVRGVVGQFVRWFLGGTFRPRTDENDCCRHIFCESHKAADTHANWLMDNGDSGPGAQWMARDLHDKMHKSRHIVLSFDGAEGEVDLVRLRGFCGYKMNTVSVFDPPVERSKSPRDDSDPWNVAWTSEHIVVWRFWGTTRLLFTG